MKMHYFVLVLCFIALLLFFGCVEEENVGKSGIEMGAEMNHFVKDIDKAKLIGIDWVRVPVRWEEVEPVKGDYNFEKFDEIVAVAEENNINLLFTMREISSWATISPPEIGKTYLASSPAKDINDWSNFLYVFSKRYSSAKTELAYEIENEVNSSAFWSASIDEYVFVLNSSYSSIKSADSDAKVLASSLACGVTKNVSGEALNSLVKEFENDFKKIIDSNSFDAVAVHNYYYPDKEVNGLTFSSYLDKIKKMLQEKEVSADVWITEFGFISKDMQVGERKDIGNNKIQVQNLKSAYNIASEFGVKKMFWITLEDREEPFFGSMGLFNTDSSKRPAGETYSLLAE